MDSAKREPFSPPRKKFRSEEIKFQSPGTYREADIFISQDEIGAIEENEKEFRKGVWIKRLIQFLMIFVLVFMVSCGIYFFWKTYATSRKINSQDLSKQTNFLQYTRAIVAPIIPDKEQDPLRGEQEGRINILLLGAAGEHKPGGNLTDTIMIMSIDMKNKKVALLSLPRDLYVQIPASTAGGPDSQSFTKINSLYAIGVKQNQGADLIKESVEKITGITIDYYVAVDFDGFVKVIDDVGGINVIAPFDIYDASYPGPNYSYETFSLSKGLHLLDGKTALQYVRERHDDPEGDFGRAKRQQQVIQAVKDKMFSAKTLFNVVALNDILTALGDNIRTDISFNEIDRFITISKEVDMQNITNVVVDAWQKDSLLKVSHVMVGSVQAFILVPRVGNYSEIQDLAQNIFDQTEIKKRQESIATENAKIEIINQSGDNQLAYKIQRLLTDKLGMNNVSVINNSQSPIAQQTTVTDNSNGAKLFTLDELIKKLPATLSNQAADASSSSYDIIIRLGSDLVDIYKYEEDSIEDYNKAQDAQANLDMLNYNQ
jgi:LCP family protein required for cell wall assembly